MLADLVSVGVWIAPTNNFQVLANLSILLQDDDLRSSIAPTVGLSRVFRVNTARILLELDFPFTLSSLTV